MFKDKNLHTMALINLPPVNTAHDHKRFFQCAFRANKCLCESDSKILMDVINTYKDREKQEANNHV